MQPPRPSLPPRPPHNHFEWTTNSTTTNGSSQSPYQSTSQTAMIQIHVQPSAPTEVAADDYRVDINDENHTSQSLSPVPLVPHPEGCEFNPQLYQYRPDQLPPPPPYHPRHDQEMIVYQPHQPLPPPINVPFVQPDEPVPQHSLASSDGEKARVLTPTELNASELPVASSSLIRRYYPLSYALNLFLFIDILLLAVLPSQVYDPTSVIVPLFSIFALFLGVPYFIEAYMSTTHKQILKIVSQQSLQDYGQQMRTANSSLELKMGCYHWETRHSRDSKGRNHSHRVQVTTFQTSEPLQVQPGGWSDRTDQIPPLNGITRIECKQELYWGNPESKQMWENQKNLLILTHHKRDAHFSYSDKLEIVGFEPNLISVPPHTVLPWWLSTRWFWICTICLASWPYRLWFDSHTNQLTFTVRRVVTN